MYSEKRYLNHKNASCQTYRTAVDNDHLDFRLLQKRRARLRAEAARSACLQIRRHVPKVPLVQVDQRGERVLLKLRV